MGCDLLDACGVGQLGDMIDLCGRYVVQGLKDQVHKQIVIPAEAEIQSKRKCEKDKL
jgi:hypothetical protein